MRCASTPQNATTPSRASPAPATIRSLNRTLVAASTRGWRPVAGDPGAADRAIPQCRPLHSGYAIRKPLTGSARPAAPLPHAPSPQAGSRSSEPAGRPARSRFVPSAAARPPPVRCEKSMPTSSIPQTWYACLLTLPLWESSEAGITRGDAGETGTFDASEARRRERSSPLAPWASCRCPCPANIARCQRCELRVHSVSWVNTSHEPGRAN